MAYKKRSPLEAMMKLREQLGHFNMASLVEGKNILICDNNSELPHQKIVNQLGETLFDSRKDWPLSYECFEETKEHIQKKEGLQNFYQLRENHINAYKRYMNSK